jgi:hypothetical protein
MAPRQRLDLTLLTGMHGRDLEAFTRQVLAQHFSQFLIVVD